MAVTERVSGPYLGLGTGDNCMDEPLLIREPEEQMRVIGPYVNADLKLDPSPAARVSTKSSSTDLKSSLRYDPLTLLHLARTQPQIPRHKLQFSDEAPIEVIPWKAFEPRYFSMGGHHYSLSIGSDDDGGVPIGRDFAQNQRSTSSSVIPEQPLRQPRGPPAGKEAQTETGFKNGPRPTVRLNELARFAQFIKERASPPQIRVTAGGRVVPVGPKSPPPTFHMDFIDRLIQVAEENKQNPGFSHDVQSIDWLGKNQTHLSNKPLKKNSVTFSTETKAVPSKRPHPNQSEESHKKIKQDDKAKEISWPDFLKLRAEIGDGSKILSVGEGEHETWFRAYIKDGKTVLEKMSAANTPPDSLQATQAAPAQDVPNIAQPSMRPDYPRAIDLHPDPNMAEGVVAHAGKEYLFAGGPNGTCYPVIPVPDQYGNVTFERFNGNVYQAPQPSTSLQALPNANNWDSLSASRSMNSMAPRAQHPVPGVYTASANPIPPSITPPPVLPLSLRGMTHNELSNDLNHITSYYNVKKSRLHSIERWLAKEEDMMDPVMKRGLYHEKGELIRCCDQSRKEKERYEQALAEVVAYMNDNQVSLPKSLSQPQLAMSGTSTPSIKGSQTSLSQRGPLMLQHEQGFTGGLQVPHHQSSLPAEFQASTVASGSKSARPSQNLFYQAFTNHKALKADAPNFVPSGPAGNFMTGDTRHAKSELSLTAKFGNTSAKTAGSQHLRSDNSRSSDLGTGGMHSNLSSTQATSRPGSKALSIRHPDGHIIEFGNGQNGSNEKRQSAIAEQRSVKSQPNNVTNNRVVGAVVPQSSNPYVTATTSAGSLGANNNFAGQKPAVQSTGTTSWTRREDESDEEFDRRCRAQRASMAKSDAVGKSIEAQTAIESTTAQASALSAPPAASNENQQFRRPQVQHFVPKAPTPGMLVPQQPVMGQMMPYQYQVQQGLYPQAGLRSLPGQYYHPSNMAVPVQYTSSDHLASMMGQMDLNARNGVMLMHHNGGATNGLQSAGLQAPTSHYQRRYSPHSGQQ